MYIINCNLWGSCGAVTKPSPGGKVPQCMHWGGRGMRAKMLVFASVQASSRPLDIAVPLPSALRASTFSPGEGMRLRRQRTHQTDIDLTGKLENAKYPQTKVCGCFLPCNYLLTTLAGAPFRKENTLETVQSMILWRLSLGAQEMWGVMMQFFAFRRGLSLRMGSVETTSRPAA